MRTGCTETIRDKVASQGLVTPEPFLPWGPRNVERNACWNQERKELCGDGHLPRIQLAAGVPDHSGLLPGCPLWTQAREHGSLLSSASWSMGLGREGWVEGDVYDRCMARSVYLSSTLEGIYMPTSMVLWSISTHLCQYWLLTRLNNFSLSP